jgi:Skp family chaperone for outer membrane proteins
LKSQAQGVEALQAQLAAPLEAEGKDLEARVKALAGKEPDSALRTRIEAFQAKENQARRQLSERAQAFERNQAHVLEQIRGKLKPAVEAVRVKRGALLVADAAASLAFAAEADATADVLAELNRTLPMISTSAPAAPSVGR